MNPDFQQQIDELKKRLDALGSFATIPLNVEGAFKDRLRGKLGDIDPDLAETLNEAPLTAITAPTGGATQDSQARTAINSIIDALEDLGLIEAN